MINILIDRYIGEHQVVERWIDDRKIEIVGT